MEIKTSIFITNALKIHGTNYDYSLVNYINNYTKVKIICYKHGMFEQTPKGHLKGKRCIKCSGIEQLSTDIFINKSNIIHSNFYDYSLVEYINNRTKVKIIYPTHGEFVQIPTNHLKGRVCMKCYINKKPTYKRKSIDNFITEANKIHNSKYLYLKSNYIDRKTDVIITCSKHGDFIQRPAHHLRGAGCPTCAETKGEESIRIFLENHNIKFEQEKRFKDLKDKSYLYYDFYLPEYNLCIEYDGKQHFEAIEYFGGEKAFLETQKRDEIKNQYCRDNNIDLLRISYKEKDKIEEIINTHLPNV